MKKPTAKIKSDEVYEVGLRNPDFNILVRSFNAFKKYLLFFFIGFVIEIIIKVAFDTWFGPL